MTKKSKKLKKAEKRAKEGSTLLVLLAIFAVLIPKSLQGNQTPFNLHRPRIRSRAIVPDARASRAASPLQCAS